jgi:hypothetical protein
MTSTNVYLRPNDFVFLKSRAYDESMAHADGLAASIAQRL